MMATRRACQHPAGRAHCPEKRAEGQSEKSLRCRKQRLADVVYRQLVHGATHGPEAT
jgi:hypothetical protein